MLPDLRGPAPGVATVEAALASSLAAQNAGDFDVYSGLYDLHFAGIRRSAQQTAHLDRASWSPSANGCPRGR